MDEHVSSRCASTHAIFERRGAFAWLGARRKIATLQRTCWRLVWTNDSATLRSDDEALPVGRRACHLRLLGQR